MVNISRVIGALSKLEGSSARVTLSGKQVLQMAEKNGASAPVSEALAGLVKKHPKLKADVAYKASEQGFTVGAMTLRNGKEVVGKGAASISGLGTEEAIIKMRLSAGKNGEIAQYSGWNNYAHSPKIQDYEIATSMKKGVIETNAKAGEFGAGRYRVDIPKAVEAAGLKEEGALALKQGNNFIDKAFGKIRDLLAGKEVDMAETPEFGFGKLFKGKKLEKVKEAQFKPKDVVDISKKDCLGGVEKFNNDENAIIDFQKKLDMIVQNMPKTEKELLEKHIRRNEGILSQLGEMKQKLGNIVQEDMKAGRGDKSALQYLQELKNQCQKAEELGFEAPKGWRDLNLDRFKDLT